MTQRQIKTTTQGKYKYGTISYYADDKAIGAALDLYGEYSDMEVEVFKRVIRKGDVVLDVGANIGALTVPLAAIVGETGKVYAVEPGDDTCFLLQKNIKQNDLDDRVEVIKAAAADTMGAEVSVSHNPNINYPKVNLPGSSPYASGSDEVTHTFTIDSLRLQKLAFAKIDVDGCEIQCLKGMRDTIKRCRPIIYIENEVPDLTEELTAMLVDMGYRGFWTRMPLYREDNHLGIKRNIFHGIVSLMQLWVPWDSGVVIKGQDEVVDLRNDDQMFSREAARYRMYSERYPEDLDNRLISAHYEHLMQNTEASAALIQENLKCDPQHWPSLNMRGLHQLQGGNYKDGWKSYELRYSLKNQDQFGGYRRPDSVNIWDGKKTENLLVWNEQGFGDSIMFARYLKFAALQAKNIVLEVQQSLFELFELSNLVPKGNLVRLHRELPDLYGPHCALPSLPAALGDDGSMIPVEGPYLFAEQHQIDRWAKITENFPIGLCWKGSSRSERPYTRDVNPNMFYPVNYRFGPFFPLVPEPGRLEFDNFASTAAAIMSLDMVITVDTSIAHLAGALGKETWLLLSYDPDWRWGLKGSTTSWYPNMRIFRQPKVRDWKSVIDEVYDALERRVALREAAE